MGRMSSLVGLLVSGTVGILATTAVAAPAYAPVRHHLTKRAFSSLNCTTQAGCGLARPEYNEVNRFCDLTEKTCQLQCAPGYYSCDWNWCTNDTGGCWAAVPIAGVQGPVPTLTSSSTTGAAAASPAAGTPTVTAAAAADTTTSPTPSPAATPSSPYLLGNVPPRTLIGVTVLITGSLFGACGIYAGLRMARNRRYDKNWVVEMDALAPPVDRGESPGLPEYYEGPHNGALATAPSPTRTAFHDDGHGHAGGYEAFSRPVPPPISTATTVAYPTPALTSGVGPDQPDALRRASTRAPSPASVSPLLTEQLTPGGAPEVSVAHLTVFASLLPPVMTYLDVDGAPVPGKSVVQPDRTYVCQRGFRAERKGELELKKREQVAVEGFAPEGNGAWLRGRNIVTGARGIFPAIILVKDASTTTLEAEAKLRAWRCSSCGCDGTQTPVRRTSKDGKQHICDECFHKRRAAKGAAQGQRPVSGAMI
ncbi:hypothetical protein M427DRAFT_55392 [Gonapodya prolifera JEL478]|uniref:SH3 domain-containing protein n=1 Tax=Gonapodya prolifera (strain JEL478) TaxID=1344416 RepID=A0A139AJ51_GONPJ|nr:hypothetical protein M427DRAFT_55392 [Gonapodya prolifera JEL478]|eukprot:KXS16425.1 hypothetical protein M427DRAFT_55392 [Gonapodya prolifera JEL478]